MSDEKILLSIANKLLRDMLGNLVPGRTLLDSGSQSNLITEEMSQVLKLKRKRVNKKKCGVENNTQHVTSAVSTIIVLNISILHYPCRVWS